MALILAGIVAVATTAFGLLAAFANMMSDAPSVQSTPVWPIFLGGYGIAAAIAGSHFLGW